MQISSLIGHTQELLSIIKKSDRPADSLIDTFFRSHKYLGSHDRQFIAETVYGTLRHLRKCEFILDSIMPHSVKILNDEDRLMLILTVFLRLENKLKELTPDLISVKIRDRKLQELLPIILTASMSPGEISEIPPVRRLGIEYSFPDWLVQRFADQFGIDEAEKICSSLNRPASLTLRVNTLKTDVDSCREELSKRGIGTVKTTYSSFGLSVNKRINVFSLKSFRDGWFEVQDEGSQLLPLLIDPKPNVKLLDLCAGAGGKTLEFAAIMKNRGEIFATDINEFRLMELRKRAKRAGAQNIRVIKIETIESYAEKYKEFFEIVFIDAPCSGTGTIRRNPGMKWLLTEKSVDELSEKQRSIIGSAAPLVKRGGKLIYATCTMLREENEDVVENFLIHHPDFILKEFDAEKLRIVRRKSGSGDKYISLFPHIHGTDGFFCAILEKQLNR